MGLPTLIARCAFASDPGANPPTYTDISAYLQEFTSKRGRTSTLVDTETGRMTWQLRNPNREFDPEHAGSPYYPNVDTKKRCQLQATWNSVTYEVFTGDAEDWPQEWTGLTNEVPLTVLDAFDALDDAEISIDRSSELSGARIGAILDAAGWPAAHRIVDAGQSMMRAEDDLTNNRIRKALEMLKEVSISEQGPIFIDAQGRVVFHNRHKRWQAPYTTVQVSLSNRPAGAELPFTDAKIDRSRHLIYNDVAVQIDGGATYKSISSVSQTKYRKRSYSITVIVSNVNEAQAMADYLVSTYGFPLTRVLKVILEPQMDDLLWPHALGREIGDRISVEIYPPGGGSPTVVESVIEGIEHRYTPGRWTTTWNLSRADQNQYWILGTGMLGTTTRLGY